MATLEKIAFQDHVLGATPLDDGRTIFRVWAPHAQAVQLTGNFNKTSFDDNQHPMEKDEAGIWNLAIENIAYDDCYRFRIKTPQGEWVERRDPYGRGTSTDHQASVMTDTSFEWDDSEFSMPAWNELVLYELHIGTFNGTEEKPATFDDCIRKIPYLKKLGINAISVMPVCTFPGDYSWGYNPTDFFSVENAYGGITAFKRFINEAHKAGIAVLIDVVYNHAGPTDIDLWQFDGWSENDGGGIYFYNDHRNQTPWGHTRFDYGRHEVRQFLHSNLMMWLDEFQLDGARFDAVIYIRKINHMESNETIDDGLNLMRWMNDTKNERFPYKITICEDIGVEPWIVSPTSEGGAGFDAQWDNEFVHAIRHALTLAEDDHRKMEPVKKVIEKTFGSNAFKRVVYSESHDDVANGHARLTYEIDGNEGDDRSFFAKKRSILGAGITLTTAGIPMLFQGQEMLEGTWFEDTDPLDWSMRKKYSGIVQAYNDLIKMRRNIDNQTRGLMGHGVEIHHVNDEQNIIAYHRFDEGGEGDDVIVIANFSGVAHHDYYIGMPKPGMWRVRFNSSSTVYDDHIDNFETLDTEAVEGEKDGMAWNANIGIGAYAFIVLSQDRV